MDTLVFRDSLEVNELSKFLAGKYAGKKLIVGRDKLDYVKGVRQKMLAYEMFLDQYPERRTDTILVQVALTTAEHNETHVAVTDVVSRINAKYGSIEHQPVVFLHQDIQHSHYLALLSVADVMMITSLRDGMNLTSHEYVLCQVKKHSPLIMSEASDSNIYINHVYEMVHIVSYNFWVSLCYSLSAHSAHLVGQLWV